ncbi:PRTRC system protein B [Mucilaginibacter segetis]|uniref:PRTRC system protein B n=1 Tax=Mucilaginibacter segetis TaxID=2793071 RepID=A0A934UM82_9SPHI|nr:PRTRC system protein B [Mucilaginibacter segetis]MBK0379373.1 PRTRC system protein B [Mucilaginibacter segetis]
MKNITQHFNSGFEPFKALLIYRNDKQEQMNQFQHTERETQIYVESYDIGKNGRPINAHPLSVKEMAALHELLKTSQELKDSYLKSRGLLPQNVLYVNQQSGGYAIWYTPPQEVNLFFTEGLKIPSGKFHIPAMLWKANAEQLAVYAVKGKTKPTITTKLCHAPYLNVYGNGQVCMGTVQINIGKTICLEDFISTWEQYFFNSNFTHSINGNNSTNTNTTALWRSLAGTEKIFPQDELIAANITLKNIIE